MSDDKPVTAGVRREATMDDMAIRVLDQGYVKLVEAWGSDERIIESARMSTAKGFLGWGPRHAPTCPYDSRAAARGNGFADCDCREDTPGDEKLLRYLWDHKHASPFEFAGLVIEVKAPIMVFREWHRHRTWSYAERSARYTPLPDEDYRPTAERVVTGAQKTANRQAAGSGREPSTDETFAWLADLADAHAHAQRVYERGIELGVPKELARLAVPVARHSVMRATANLRNVLAFLALRCDGAAQAEIRECANALAMIVNERFPRTYEVARASLGLP